MKVSVFLTHAVQNGTKRVSHTAGEQEYDSAEIHSRVRLLRTKYDAPSHCKVAYHGEYLVAFQINGIQCDSECRRTPDHTEDRPPESGVVFAERTQSNRGVRSGDQQKDGAVVDDLKNLFARGVRAKSVIDA